MASSKSPSKGVGRALRSFIRGRRRAPSVADSGRTSPGGRLPSVDARGPRKANQSDNEGHGSDTPVDDDGDPAWGI